MAGVQLRRYDIVAGNMDTFLEMWPRLLHSLERYGFTVPFALVDRAHNEFVWALSHDGDFATVEKAYKATAEHRALLVDIRPTMTGHQAGMVDVIVAPGGPPSRGSSP